MSKADMSLFKKRREVDRSASSENSNLLERAENVQEEKDVASPLLSTAGRWNGAKGVKKIERKLLKMPVTKTEVELTAMNVDPKECLIHPKNRRIQALLNVDNSEIVNLINSMKEEGQREPALARLVDVDGESKVEIIDGSRRRFASKLLQEEDKNFKFKIWLGNNINNVDADFLTKSENENRDAISAWETAQYLKKVEASNPTWSHDVIGASEGMARQTVSDYLAIADIPLTIVTLLRTPHLLTVNAGLQVLKIMNSLTKNEQEGCLEQLKKSAPYSRMNDLVKSLKQTITPQSEKKPTANKKIKIKCGEKVRAEVGKNRKVVGQYKIDLYDLSDVEYNKLLKAIQKILS